ncbi:MFS transporter [Enterococcus cecorum]|nr:MFS transporter [Enterococcus cecorum]
MTRDGEEITKITSTRMTMASIANLLVYTLFPLFVQLLSPGSKLQDIGLFGIKLKLGNYMTSDANISWFKVYAIYMIIGFAALLICYFGTKERVLPKKQAETVKYSDLFIELKKIVRCKF